MSGWLTQVQTFGGRTPAPGGLHVNLPSLTSQTTLGSAPVPFPDIQKLCLDSAWAPVTQEHLEYMITF